MINRRGAPIQSCSFVNSRCNHDTCSERSRSGGLCCAWVEKEQQEDYRGNSSDRAADG